MAERDTSNVGRPPSVISTKELFSAGMTLAKFHFQHFFLLITSSHSSSTRDSIILFIVKDAATATTNHLSPPPSFSFSS